MFHGALISNAFLKTEKFLEHYQWLKKAAKQFGIALSLFDNTKMVGVLGQEYTWLDDMDFILYWDKDILQGEVLYDVCIEKGIPVYNSIDAIAVSDHKYETYRKIWNWNRRQKRENRIKLLPTVIAPMTYDNIGYTELGFVDSVIEKLGLPLVIKECFGSFGMQVYLAGDRQEVLQRTGQLAGIPFLYQKYEEGSHGRDVRLQVVGNRVVAGMERYSESGDFRANLTNGGSMKPYEPTQRECQIAVQACEILGLDFGGVDLLFGESGQADILCEINSNAHFKNIYTCTGVNVAEKIMEYISQKILSDR